MKLLLCHCSYCKHGRHRGPHDAMVRQKAKRAKSDVRAMIRKGEYEKLPQRVAIGYTD